MNTRGARVTDFVLIPGAGGIATPYWRLVSAQLEAAGHRSLPVDLPGGDPDSGLPEYVALVVRAIRDSAEPLVVAQSLGGFSAVMACDRVQARGLVFVNAMVPALGETPGEWWEATGAVDARVAAAKAGGYSVEFDVKTYFLHDLGAEDAASVLGNPGYESDIAFRQPCDLARWPDVPTAAVIGRDDRLFPVEFQRRVLQERAGIDATVISGGHLLALANPDELVEVLLKLAT
jgi:pimeloyl-ACP methyl ester carboxylesterase